MFRKFKSKIKSKIKRKKKIEQKQYNEGRPVTQLPELPPEMLCHVFSFLKTRRDMVNAGTACSAWRGPAIDHLLQQAKINYYHAPQALLAKLEMLLEKINKDLLTVGIVGEKGALLPMSEMENSGRIHFIFVEQGQNMRDGLRESDVYLLCPSANRNINNELKEIKFQLKNWLKMKTPIVFVLNLPSNEYKDFYPLELHKNDTLDSLYERMCRILREKANEESARLAKLKRLFANEVNKESLAPKAPRRI